MGTTRIKVIDLSGEKEQIKTSRKHAEKLTGVAKIKSTGPEGAFAPRDEKKTKVKEIPEDKKGLEALQPSEPSALPTEALAKEKPSIPAQPIANVEKKITTGKITRHRHLGRKYLEAKALIEPQKLYSAPDAIVLLYKTSHAKFDPTVEIHLNVTEKNLRGRVNLPHTVLAKSVGKTLVFTDTKINGLKNVLWANEKTIDEIAQGKLKPNRDFDKVLSAPKFMASLAKIAKILGPKGLMPNPKNGTVTDDIAGALKASGGDGLEYKTDPNVPIVHTRIGKLSFKPQDLEQNLKALIGSIGPTKIKKATISTTMSPGIKIDISALSA